jgi:UDP-GlcNAc:undecaprenyl-phosphate GlcNAc-1-phosphate transferase
VMVLSIPLLDVFLSVHRRIRGHQPILRGDRGHIHHRLLALGFSPKRAVLVLYAVCALGAAFSIFQSAADRYAGAAVLAFCCSTLAAIHLLRRSEVQRMRRVMRDALNDGRDAETPLTSLVEP